MEHKQPLELLYTLSESEFNDFLCETQLVVISNKTISDVEFHRNVILGKYLEIRNKVNDGRWRD